MSKEITLIDLDAKSKRTFVLGIPFNYSIEKLNVRVTYLDKNMKSQVIDQGIVRIEIFVKKEEEQKNESSTV